MLIQDVAILTPCLTYSVVSKCLHLTLVSNCFRRSV